MCKTPGCKTPPSKGHYCFKCIKRTYRAKNPVKSSFQNLKDSAKKRGISFSLTLKEFKSFCVKTKYMQNKGIFKNSLHVDRIIESEGYHSGNIQVLENHENVKKYVAWAGRDETGQNHFKTITVNPPDHENVPF